MSDVYLGKTRVRLDPTRLLGKGGEAEVYAVDPDLALKIWKGATHEDLLGQPAQQAAAVARLDEQQHKLRAFPRGMPAEVVAPIEACMDRRGRVVGYAMKRVEQAEPLARWAEPAARRTRSVNDVVTIFRRLHPVLSALHRAGVVLGDFNDLNVLVRDRAPHLIDADSWQYGGFLASAFTERFVDPLLLDAHGKMVRPYGTDADWYAFAALLFQSLLCVGPWGGVHKKIAPGARSLQRIWVLNREVKYPRPAIDPRALPAELLSVLEEIFVRDRRGPFDDALLCPTFARCSSCGLEHARRSCPACTVVVPVIAVRGSVRVRNVFATDGVIVCARLYGDALHVVHHADGAYRDRSGVVLLRSALEPGQRWAWHGATAVRDVVASSRHRYWCDDGRLYRDGVLGDERLGDVLAGRTQLFVGESFGLGLYRAGARTIAFLFDASKRGINDSLALPRLPGQLVDVRACFDDARVWLLLTHAHAGTREHHALVYDRAGTLLGSTVARAHEGTWLDSRGTVAIAGALLVATDDGLCRVEVQRGALVRTREFPDTEPFVDAQCELLAGEGGLHIVSSRRITALSLG